jgi:hypothetical protein
MARAAAAPRGGRAAAVGPHSYGKPADSDPAAWRSPASLRLALPGGPSRAGQPGARESQLEGPALVPYLNSGAAVPGLTTGRVDINGRDDGDDCWSTVRK